MRWSKERRLRQPGTGGPGLARRQLLLCCLNRLLVSLSPFLSSPPSSLPLFRSLPFLTPHYTFFSHSFLPLFCPLPSFSLHPTTPFFSPPLVFPLIFFPPLSSLLPPLLPSLLPSPVRKLDSLAHTHRVELSELKIRYVCMCMYV